MHLFGIGLGVSLQPKNQGTKIMETIKSMEKGTVLMEAIREAASKLKDGKLQNLPAIQPALCRVQQALSLVSEDEAVAFVALFDCQCSHDDTDMGDLADYFDCSTLEAMRLVPSLKALVEKGYVAISDRKKERATHKKYALDPDVMLAIVEGHTPKPLPQDKRDEYDQFDFCERVSNMKEERSDGDIDTRRLFRYVERLENENANLPLVSELRARISDVECRTLFYEMCKDFMGSNHNRRRTSTDISKTLGDIYDRPLARTLVKGSICDGSHPLVAAKLIRLSAEDDIKLTRSGLQLLYGEKCDMVIGSGKVSDRFDFVARVEEIVTDSPSKVTEQTFVEINSELRQLEEDNSDMSMVSNVQMLIKDTTSRVLFYLICQKMLEGDTYPISYLTDFMSSSRALRMKNDFKCGIHPLEASGLTEIVVKGFLENSHLALTDKGKEIFLEEDLHLFESQVSDKDLIQPDKIVEKQLFFPDKLQNQLSTLCDSLREDNYQRLCRRMEEKHLPTGVAVLLYGKPGTGKTETAMQIARETGRAVMHVDISATKTCWFGESEKLIKEVFTNYRNLCKKSSVKPILLFNEADAVFSKRKDSNASNVAQTENAIQNIILEEMERLDGILIATTNLADNLDHAFERRFLFKIKYDNPTLEAKQKIWLDKMPTLTDEDAAQLAAAYDFSGGQIDNIVRKSLMEEVVRGMKPTLSTLMTMCDQETLTSGNKSKIGF